MYKRLVESINSFEEKLPDDMQAGGRLVCFGESFTFAIEDIGYWNPHLIIFYGRLPNGEPVELYQHLSQVSVLVTAVKRSDPSVPRRKIGFCSEDESAE